MTPENENPHFWQFFQTRNIYQRGVNFGGTIQISAQSDHFCARDGISKKIDQSFWDSRCDLGQIRPPLVQNWGMNSLCIKGLMQSLRGGGSPPPTLFFRLKFQTPITIYILKALNKTKKNFQKKFRKMPKGSRSGPKRFEKCPGAKACIFQSFDSFWLKL